MYDITLTNVPQKDMYLIVIRRARLGREPEECYQHYPFDDHAEHTRREAFMAATTYCEGVQRGWRYANLNYYTNGLIGYGDRTRELSRIKIEEESRAQQTTCTSCGKHDPEGLVDGLCTYCEHEFAS